MKTVYQILILLISAPCFGAEVVFDTDVKVRVGGTQSFTEQKSGTSMQVKPGSELLILSKKNMPILVLAPQSSLSRINITEGLLTELMTEYTRDSVEKATSTIVAELSKAELLLRKRELTRALDILNTLKRNYPNISSILFMRGTVLYLMNNKPSAIEDLDAGLKIEPNNEPAQKLLQRLRGEGTT